MVLGDLTRSGAEPLHNTVWLTLNVHLPSRMCHFGTVQRTNAMDYTQIVIFGGWAPQGSLKAYLLREDLSSSRQLLSHSLLEIRSVKGCDALQV